MFNKSLQILSLIEDNVSTTYSNDFEKNSLLEFVEILKEYCFTAKNLYRESQLNCDEILKIWELMKRKIVDFINALIWWRYDKENQYLFSLAQALKYLIFNA